MDGAVAESLRSNEAASGAFGLATPADVGEIRRLLRANPMDGAIRLSFEPAPHADPLASPGAGVHQVLVGRRDDGSIFGLGTRTIRPAYLNGQLTPLGYLGSLRLDADHRHQARTLLRGYEKLRELHEADGACRLYLTSIMIDNHPARRFLEANLRGMPTYRFVGEFVSLVMRVRRSVNMLWRPFDSARRRLKRESLRMRPCSPDRMSELGSLLERCAARKQFAPAASVNAAFLQTPATSDFRLVINSGGAVVACAALRDLRCARHIVIRGYSPHLARWKWSINLAAGLMGRPRLPDVGQPLKLAYVSHMAGTDELSPEATVGLIEGLHALVGTRDVDYLAAGFSSRDTHLTTLRNRFGGRELRSRLYIVYWPDGKAAADALDRRPLGPEVSLL